MTLESPEPMMDTQDQILRQCRAGEDSRAEFKEVRFGSRASVSPNSHDMAGEMVAFANGVAGSSSSGSATPRGCRDPTGARRSDREVARNIASNNCVPLIRPTLRRELLPDDAGGERHVMLAEVPRGNFVHRTVGGRYLVRAARPNVTSTRPSSRDSSRIAAAATSSTSNPCSPPTSTISTGTGWSRSSAALRPSLAGSSS